MLETYPILFLISLLKLKLYVTLVRIYMVGVRGLGHRFSPAGSPVDPLSLAFARCESFSSCTNKNTATTFGDICVFGRGARTRTADPQYPILVRYQLRHTPTFHEFTIYRYNFSTVGGGSRQQRKRATLDCHVAGAPATTLKLRSTSRNDVDEFGVTTLKAFKGQKVEGA